MKFFRGCGLSAGTEYGLTGFDGTSILDYVVPRIDTIDNHEKEIGHAAVDMQPWTCCCPSLRRKTARPIW